MEKPLHRVAPAADNPPGDAIANFGRAIEHGKPDFAHGVILYLDDISVSFDGFRR